MTVAAEVRRAFPRLDSIDDAIAEQVVDAWVFVHEEGDWDSIHDVPFFPDRQDALGDQSQVDHLRDVLDASLALADSLAETRGVEYDADILVAGVLTHDIDKPLIDADPDLGDLLPHPHLGIYVLETFDLPPEVIHIAISHSHTSAVDPRTWEAKIVQLVDLLAVHGTFWAETGHLLGDG